MNYYELALNRVRAGIPTVIVPGEIEGNQALVYFSARPTPQIIGQAFHPNELNRLGFLVGLCVLTRKKAQESYSMAPLA